MGIIVQKCLYDYDCSKCRGDQTNCVAFAQKKWHDTSVLNQKHLSELEELKDKIASGELVPVIHGKWEKVIPSKSAAKWSTKVSCSICHLQGYERYKYCHQCGAKMDLS